MPWLPVGTAMDTQYHTSVELRVSFSTLTIDMEDSSLILFFLVNGLSFCGQCEFIYLVTFPLGSSNLEPNL